MREFDRFKDVDVPDQWDDIVRRSAADVAEPVPVATVGTRRRWTMPLVAASVLVVAMVGGLALLNRQSEDVLGPAERSPDVAPTGPAREPTTSNSLVVPTTDPSRTTEVPVLRCSEDFDRIIRLMGDSFPVVDYDKSPHLEALVAKSEVVVTGSITSFATAAQTVFEARDVEVLAGQGIVDRLGAISGGSGAEASVDGLRFVAFLHANDSWPGGWVAAPDGLYLGCETGAALPYLDAPDDVNGLSIDELSERARSLSWAALRPVFADARCVPISAGAGPDEPSGQFVLFTRRSANPVALQVVGRPGDTAADPTALIMRSYGDARSIGDGEERINGWPAQIRTYESGNGDATWDLSDGSQGYLRTRDMSEDDIRSIIESLSPLPTDAAFNGFAVEDPLGRFVSIDQQMDRDFSGGSSGSKCEILAGDESGDVSASYSIVAITGDPVFQLARVLDRPPPLEVGTWNDAVVIVEGWRDGAPLRVSDIVNADRTAWRELVEATVQPEF